MYMMYSNFQLIVNSLSAVICHFQSIMNSVEFGVGYKISLWHGKCKRENRIKHLALMSSITIRPGFPGHMLFLVSCAGVWADIQKSTRCLGFWSTTTVSDKQCCTCSHLNVRPSSKGKTFTVYLPSKSLFRPKNVASDSSNHLFHVCSLFHLSICCNINGHSYNVV